MNALVRYVLSVTAAALLVSILRTISGGGSMSRLTKLLSGLFLAITVLSPLVHLEIPDPGSWLEYHLAEGEAAAADGEAMAKAYTDAIISAEVEAYILDKAADLGCAISAEVRLDDGGMPRSLVLSGEISTARKAELTRMLARDLGLGEEAVTWSD